MIHDKSTYVDFNLQDSKSSLASSIRDDTSKASPKIPVVPLIEYSSQSTTTNQKKNDNSNDPDDRFYGKRKRQKDFCFYCETLVQSFARHVTRNHSQELDVQKILSLPTKNKERKDLLTDLRKKGNYLYSNKSQKAVKKGTRKRNLLPCSGCLGFYSADHLWRHRKKCTKNISTNYAKADGQNLLLRHLTIDSDLREKVFPRMRADDVSLTAKKDPLICEFGSRYLKVHRESHFINVVSRKMRELARFLIEMRKFDSNITTLFSVLKPQNFDLIIQATKNVAKYDSDKESYKSPSYAMNFGTSIKQCCEIAIYHALKKKDSYETVCSAETEAELKTVIQLVTAHWKFHISTLAGNDLSIKKWNRVTLIPFASDIKLLKEYLVMKGNEAVCKLVDEPDETYYKILMETVYCRIILLNRRRPGELQRMMLDTYEKSLTNVNNQNYEEFSEAISPTEKILMKHFKRVVIRGKRGRGVPVLFSKEIQEHSKVLLKYRSRFISKNNLYFFGQTKSREPICGYKVIKKYAKECGAKNHHAITSTKLRKHLATLSQIFDMNENDLEQLATFMGHTLGVHRQNYRLPDDVFQTAKIAKILLLMEHGSLSQFKGKTLDEINLDLEEDLLDIDNKDANESQMDDTITPIVGSENIDEENDLMEEILKRKSENREKIPIKFTHERKQAGKRTWVPWTEEQKKMLLPFSKII